MKKNIIIFSLWGLLMAAEVLVLCGFIPMPDPQLWLPISNAVAFVAIAFSLGWEPKWQEDCEKILLPIYLASALFQAITVIAVINKPPVNGGDLANSLVWGFAVSMLAPLLAVIAWVLAWQTCQVRIFGWKSLKM